MSDTRVLFRLRMDALPEEIDYAGLGNLETTMTLQTLS